MKKVSSVEEYIEKYENFTEALTLIRDILNTTELVETLKWSAPVYTINDKNVMGLGAFKHHFGIWFFNGIFLKDKQKLLVINLTGFYRNFIMQHILYHYD